MSHDSDSEWDADTLIRAEAIKKDTLRFVAAKIAAAKMAAKKKQEALEAAKIGKASIRESLRSNKT